MGERTGKGSRIGRHRDRNRLGTDEGALQYETPTVIELGGVVELTNGSGEDEARRRQRRIQHH
ncbi:lasso RiPP family leader peptide-containing protein [Amycolatopsis rhizosphaerae]|uniref:Lasso RiPP family leader peptide-containing protein n=1 Tax=Amycolatopsis rhizosphaerae TaxID=2053003 RepID=A0A558DLK4_9PSEU|nr:lasso RiPP family leader peptide-containing protein [Amycolatopsis rhizosphaerae]TVT61899.1 lasso RiPP family leader peptide-containing protein [Amycolatopsis rhizosphaerae]